MKRSFVNFVSFSALLTAVFGVHTVCAEQMPNPRSARVVNVAPQRADGAAMVRGNGANVISGASRSTVARTGTVSVRNVSDSSSRATMSRSAVRQGAGRRADVTSARNAKNAAVVRSAISGLRGNARAASTPVLSGLARAAARSRATAIFSDVSKLGSGYASCREAYATCMDQFCANANDTYRRCFCSSRFTEFRDTELALDQAKVLIQRFEDNNLNAVDKTAAEVDAMYSASIGEAAIKNDTSGAQQLLDEIGDLLSGKKKADENPNNNLNLLSLDFSTDMDDIWGGSGSSIFDTDKKVSLSELEGQRLFDATNKQCLDIVGDQCESDAILNMATSSYGIMITQDCNAYEKSVNKKREAVMNTVRQAEKVLREARLEEYRAHNSQDVNECLGKVRKAMLTDVACGENYERCLDYTGVFVKQTTGEAIYSPRLFMLADTIKLDGKSSDVLGSNTEFDKFIETKKMFATTALDTCRDISDTVWTEFKRTALIEIAQAQDELIESVKMSCVNTMKECYDTQSDSLKSFDDTTAKAAGALSAIAAKEMCKEKVTTCAALYSQGGDGCKFDSNGHLDEKAGGDAKKCGLAALLAFVDTVDDVRIAEGCEAAIDSHLKELCTPTTGDMGYPWNCRLRARKSTNNTDTSSAAGSNTGRSITNRSDSFDSIETIIMDYALDNCAVGATTYDSLDATIRLKVENSLNDMYEQLEYQLIDACEALDGVWMTADDKWLEKTNFNVNAPLVTAFYTSVWNSVSQEVSDTWGKCIENTTMVQCLAYNDESREENYATYNREKDECTFSEEWYQLRCSMLGNGYYENGVCYLVPNSMTSETQSE